MTNYAKLSGSQPTPQTKPTSPDQIKNSAGGYVFDAGKWTTLDRFLIMGVTGNTFYANQRDIVTSNVQDLISCIKEDGVRYVQRIREIDAQNRAVKQDTAAFALALAMKHGDIQTRHEAYANVRFICRTFTHLTRLLSDRKTLGLGWGRGIRSAVADWYEHNGCEYLIYQGLKYPNRNGWSQRKVIRLSHPKTDDPKRNLVYRWLAARTSETREGKQTKQEIAEELWHTYGYSQAYARDLLFATPTVEQAVKGIRGEKLTHEMIPTELLADARVWAALLEDMLFGAMVRNLNRLSSLRVIDPVREIPIVTDKLNNKDFVKLSRIHPVNFLIAQRVYSQGHGEKGKLTWTPNQQVIVALENAFHNALDAWPPKGKSLMICVDISGSMTSMRISDAIPFTPAEMAGAMACALIHAEPTSMVMGFTTKFEPLKIYSNTTLQSAMVETQAYQQQMGATDCAMPMLYALGYETQQAVVRGRINVNTPVKSNRQPINVDAFIILTDNETWAGGIHPHQALADYRRTVNPNAKLVVCTMQPARHSISIADPNDKNSLDIVGFDSSVPQLIQDFVTSGG